MYLKCGVKIPCTNRNLAKLTEGYLQLQPPSTPTVERSLPGGQRSRTILISPPYFLKIKSVLSIENKIKNYLPVDEV